MGGLSRVAGDFVAGTPSTNIYTLSLHDALPILALSATTVNFTITPKPVVVTPTSGQSKVFGASDPTLAFANDASPAADTSAVEPARAAGGRVGTDAISLGSLSAGTNYTLSLSTG